MAKSPVSSNQWWLVTVELIYISLAHTRSADTTKHEGFNIQVGYYDHFFVLKTVNNTIMTSL